MNLKKQIFASMEWSFKELGLLLLLVLVIVPVTIEYLLQDFLHEWFQNSLYSGTLTGLIMAIIFIAGVYFIALKPHELRWTDNGLQAFSKSYWGFIVIWFIALIASSILILILMELWGIGTENSKTESLQQNISLLTILIGFVSAAIVSPVYEEIFYRGFLYKWFRVKWGVGAGLILSSIIFTIVHIPTYNTLPVNFVSGVICAWCYEKTGSIVPRMIVHGGFNGLAVILTAL
ncbi:CPBP family intramembrane glutamic endopeptidase [Paenibacillus shunpengii]|uniref:CPBP family intramembrane glutamic endopeptidase n=1 Tax=Paenibacillus shunpengii TaxID=2054424 RepID=A0ABW5SPJ8_9BACL